jgi:hypothetical protein
MNVVIMIDGREAVPVRAIPYVNWNFLSPDVVAESFAKRLEFNRLDDLIVYHIEQDGSIREMLPREWDDAVSLLTALQKELAACRTDAYPRIKSGDAGA